MIDLLRVGTRGSALALRQTELAVEALRGVRDFDVEVVTISTKGDRDKSSRFEQLGPKGIFAAEIQRALIDDEIDLAVHSLKDLVASEPEGLDIAAVLEREDPRDVVVGGRLQDLPDGAVVGTSSVRREALLRELYPRLRTAPLRGNVDTRLRKVSDGEVDAAILAAAGIVRLGRTSEITEWLDPASFVPPPGQGAIAIEARTGRLAGDLAFVRDAEHRVTRACVDAERAFLRIVEGSCEVPLGAWARYEDDTIVLHGFLVTDAVKRASVAGKDPATLGRELAALLL